MANIYQDEAMRVTLSRIIRANMDLEGHTYKTLCSELQSQFGIEHNPDTLRNKVSSGSLGAQMLFFILMTLNVENFPLEQARQMYAKIKSTPSQT